MELASAWHIYQEHSDQHHSGQVPMKQISIGVIFELHLPLAFLHLLHCFWKVFVESLREEEVYHR